MLRYGSLIAVWGCILTLAALPARADIMLPGTACTGSANYNSNNGILTCNGSSYAASPTFIGLSASAPYTCASTYKGMVYYDTTANGLEFCNGSSWVVDGSNSSQWTTSGSNIYYSTGNVGIGTTAPYAPLEISATAAGNKGMLAIEDTGHASTSAGLAAGISGYGSDIGSGTTGRSWYLGNDASAQQFDVYYAQNAPMAFWTNNTQQMIILGSGNVGIGTATPGAVLEVNGTAKIDSILRGGVPTSGNYPGTLTFSGSDAYIDASGTSGNMFLRTNGSLTTVMTLLSGGNVGIGTTTPADVLDVQGGNNRIRVGSGNGAGSGIVVGNISSGGAGLWDTVYATTPSASNAIIYAGGAGNVLFGSPAAGVVAFGISGTEKMRLDTSGNVGIGTTTVSSVLDVMGDIRSENVGGSSANFIATSVGTNANIQFSRAGYQAWFLGSPNNSVDFGLSEGSIGTYRIYFQSGGNVGIGTTAPAYLLHVGSASASGIVAEFQNSSGACTHSPGPSSETVSCSSDVRLKKDIVDSGDALAWLGDMRVRDFTVRATGERRTGVIAQEMLPAHPDMVHMGPDNLYKVDEPNPWEFVKAIQELKADNDNLRGANDDLRAEFHAYKAAHP